MTEKEVPLAARLAAEAAGTFALVLVGTGAICWADPHGPLGHLGVSLAFGAVVTAMVLLFGSLSGAHINPAVTLGFAAARRFGWRQVLPYTLAQLAGALGASLAVARLFPTHASLGATLPRLPWAGAFAVELALTGALMLVILVASAHPRLRLPHLALAVGATVALGAYLGGPWTGASMNPARSFGPAVVLGSVGSAGPLLRRSGARRVARGPDLPVLRASGLLPAGGGNPVTRAAPGGLPRRPRIAFVCVENSCRSQMAEAFTRHHGGDRVDVASAGSRPSGEVNPGAVRAMAARGIDLGRQRSKGLRELEGVELDLVVTMGCGDACPALRAKQREDWSIEDPKHLPEAGFARVRDELERRVLALLERLGVSNPG